MGDSNGEGPQQGRPAESGPTYALGLSLDGASQMADDLFVGREKELVRMQELLSPTTRTRNVVAVSGLGGMGKTQLCIHYAKQYHEMYSSIFWLNAKDESTVKAGIVNVVMRVTDSPSAPRAGNLSNQEEAVKWFLSWLSKSENSRWLVIFDNYDDPDVPGMRSTTGYDLRQFFPPRQHGSILITTRVTRLNFATQLKLWKIEEPGESLMILANRSGRKTESDQGAKDLALRLDGLPLALATAGSYLSQTTGTFDNYLQLYEERLQELEQNSEGLLEYNDRRLWTTWAISLKQIESHDPEAVKLMQFLAYFDNQDICYELLRPGADCELPWLSDVVRNETTFNRAMAKLHDYSLIDVRPGSYSIHPCVHDWALGFLNGDLNSDLYWTATYCVSQNVRDNWWGTKYIEDRRLLQHAIRLQSERLKSMMDGNMGNMQDLYDIAVLYQLLDVLKKAELVNLRVLQVTEQNESMWSQENILRLKTLCRLGGVYTSQGRLTEAEELLLNALAGQETLYGREHMRTIGTLDSLGALYIQQGKMAEAEKTFLQTVAGSERMWGSANIQTLKSVGHLGQCYMHQGKMAEAESKFLQALTGFEKLCGRGDAYTPSILDMLGDLYSRQEKIARAVEMYQRALEGYQRVLGPEHTNTLQVVCDLGWLYWKQGKLVEAEQMVLRVLAGYEKTLGLEHTKTLRTVWDLGWLYSEQGKLVEAEQMYLKAFEGYEKTLGPEHNKILGVVYDLGRLYLEQGKLFEAEQMYLRAFEGYERTLGPQDELTLRTASELGYIRNQKKELSRKAKHKVKGWVNTITVRWFNRAHSRG